MSDDAQILVAIDCPLDEAQRYGDVVVAWLVDRGVVESILCDCVLGGDGLGHPPGPNLEIAADGDLTRTRRLSTNGLGVVVGRTVFDNGGNGVELECASCSAIFEPASDWTAAVGSWADGDDDVRYACPSCGRARAVRDWTGPWPWGLGNLGFEFWNWPPLRDDFVGEVSRSLPGRVRLVRQRI